MEGDEDIEVDPLADPLENPKPSSSSNVTNVTDIIVEPDINFENNNEDKEEEEEEEEEGEEEMRFTQSQIQTQTAVVRDISPKNAALNSEILSCKATLTALDSQIMSLRAVCSNLKEYFFFVFLEIYL